MSKIHITLPRFFFITPRLLLWLPVVICLFIVVGSLLKTTINTALFSHRYSAIQQKTNKKIVRAASSTTKPDTTHTPITTSPASTPFITPAPSVLKSPHLQPTEALAHGMQTYNNKDYLESIAYLKSAIEAFPKNFQIRTMLRRAYDKSHSDIQDLEAFYKSLIKKYPKEANYLVSLGTIYMAEYQDFNKADEIYHQALEVEHGNKGALYNLKILKKITTSK